MAGKKAGNLNKTTVAELANDKAVVYKIKNAKGDNVYTGAVARGKVQEQIARHIRGGEEAIPGGKTVQLTQKDTVAEARKSVAMTDAPESCDGPWIRAKEPSIRMSAPIRTSSGTCWKRFSNTVSDTIEEPAAWVISAMY